MQPRTLILVIINKSNPPAQAIRGAWDQAIARELRLADRTGDSTTLEWLVRSSFEPRAATAN